jgi:hypothetical protein
MTRQEENLEQALRNLEAIKAFEVSPAYDLIVKPLQAQYDSLKTAYDCKTLQEIATLKGKEIGFRYVLDLIKLYNDQGQMAQEAIQKLEEKKRLANQEFDSTNL